MYSGILNLGCTAKSEKGLMGDAQNSGISPRPRPLNALFFEIFCYTVPRFGVYTSNSLT